MATIKDVARLAGVSTATVSNVLNGKQGAAGAQKTHEIFEVARRLNYQPNTLAKNLKKQRTHSLGIITEDLTVFNTPEIVDGIDAYCEENDYEIILANMRLYKRYNNDFTDTPKHHQLFDAMVRNMVAKQVEGIIYVGYHSREIIYLPSMVSIPFVYAYCFPQEAIYPAVMIDDEKAAYDVTALLAGLGHRKIGAICGPLASYNAQSRLKGFQRALFENDILYDADLTCYGEWDRKSGYTAADTLLDRGATAIFAFNDRMASGVYMRCLERGLAIGGDISLFGYDDTDVCQGYRPSISSVAPPLYEMGRRSAELALTQIRRHKVSSQPQLLPCALQLRKSVAAPR